MCNALDYQGCEDSASENEAFFLESEVQGKSRVKTANNHSDYHICIEYYFIAPFSQPYLWHCHFFVVILLLVNSSATNSNKILYARCKRANQIKEA